MSKSRHKKWFDNFDSDGEEARQRSWKNKKNRRNDRKVRQKIKSRFLEDKSFMREDDDAANV